MSNHVDAEIQSQPDCWRAAAVVAAEQADLLPRPGERLAVVGCGTSWFVAMAYAALREAGGHGETDAFAASEAPVGRRYDRVLAITRSGTTTEVLRFLEEVGDTPTLTVTGVPKMPVEAVSDETIVLDFADEESVVQTRFATSALAFLRVHLGEDIEPVARAGERALAVDVAPYLGADQVTFLGRGATVGLAHEAALKAREAAQFWSESYPAMDYRHGPISIAQPGRVVWCLGEQADGLAEDVEATGATLVHHPDLDPLAQLVVAQRFAIGLAHARGLDPDRPRHLARSVVLR